MVITWILYKMAKFKSRNISFKGRRLRLYVADNFAAQAVGLMYRKSLEKDAGMLFVFGKDDKWGIWMPNMKFSIDIVWIDANGRIVDIKKNAPPSKSIFVSEVYKPKEAARYVLELNEGYSSRYGMRVGEPVRLD
jgi:uncharacterized protein